MVGRQWRVSVLKWLEKARFVWPPIGHHRVQLHHAQLLALVNGMEAGPGGAEHATGIGRLDITADSESDRENSGQTTAGCALIGHAVP